MNERCACGAPGIRDPKTDVTTCASCRAIEATSLATIYRARAELEHDLLVRIERFRMETTLLPKDVTLVCGVTVGEGRVLRSVRVEVEL